MQPGCSFKVQDLDVPSCKMLRVSRYCGIFWIVESWIACKSTRKACLFQAMQRMHRVITAVGMLALLCTPARGRFRKSPSIYTATAVSGYILVLTCSDAVPTRSHKAWRYEIRMYSKKRFKQLWCPWAASSAEQIIVATGAKARPCNSGVGTLQQMSASCLWQQR